MAAFGREARRALRGRRSSRTVSILSAAGSPIAPANAPSIAVEMR